MKKEHLLLLSSSNDLSLEYFIVVERWIAWVLNDVRSVKELCDVDMKSNPNLFVVNVEPEEEEFREKSLVIISSSNSVGLGYFNVVEWCGGEITLLLHNTLKDWELKDETLCYSTLQMSRVWNMLMLLNSDKIESFW